MLRIGIDLGGTNIKVGIVNEKHKIICQCSEPTEIGKPAEHIADRIAYLVRMLMKENKINREEISFLGIGSPGAIDIKRGLVLFSNNFMWENVPLAEMIYSRLSFPVLMANDAQCALMGERAAGAAADCNNVVLITLGTGVGGGILADGKLLDYEKGGGIIGHMVIHKNGRKCSCGRRGCLEAYASASALIRRAERCIRKYPDSMLTEYHAKLCGITGKAVFDAAKEQDSLAKKIIKEYIEYLGEGIAKVFKGSLHHISGKFAHRLVNVGNEQLKVGACWSPAAGHDYEAIEKREFPYRVFADNGTIICRERST